MNGGRTKRHLRLILGGSDPTPNPASSQQIADAAHHIRLARHAQDALDLRSQITYAQAANDLLQAGPEPTGPLRGELFRDATHLEVDAHLNLADFDAAHQRAKASNDLAGRRSLLPRTRSMAPQSVVNGLEFCEALTLELSGLPGDAMRRYWTTFSRMRHDDFDLVPDLDRLRALQGVLSAAKRTGTPEAHALGRRAIEAGSEVLARRTPATASDTVTLAVTNYRQWAGYFEAATIGHGGSVRAARDHLRWALEHRPNTARADATRPMLHGELYLLGEPHRRKAVRHFTRCLRTFDDVLPRHAASTRSMLNVRGLAG